MDILGAMLYCFLARLTITAINLGVNNNTTVAKPALVVSSITFIISYITIIILCKIGIITSLDTYILLVFLALVLECGLFLAILFKD